LFRLSVIMLVFFFGDFGFSYTIYIMVISRKFAF